jgi:hypothetical protein
MSNGIDQSKLVLVFVTRAYIDKVQGYGRRGLDDNCKAEFEYALRRHGTRRMLVVRGGHGPRRTTASTRRHGRGLSAFGWARRSTTT